MNDVFRFGRFRLTPATRSLRKDDIDVALGSRAFDILVALVEGGGKVLTRRELMACAWSGLVVEESNVRVQVAHLRKTLGCGEQGVRFIASVAGRGYCFVADVLREPELQPAGSNAPAHSSPGAGLRESRSLANAPVSQDRIVGSEEGVAELAAQIRTSRLVTVVGAAGMGKTTVAVLAARALDSFGDAIHFVDLSVITSDAQVLEALSSDADYRPSGAVSVAGLAEFLDRRPTLVVLDNCEHVIGGIASLIRQILDRTHRVSILCTSREALRLSDEHVYVVRSLASPPNTGRLTVEQAMAWPAVQLFVARAEEGGAHEVLSDESASLVAAICRRLDGNPLAIELAASRVSTYGVQGVSELLCGRSTLHWQGRRDAAPRHQTVEALLDWTYELLSPRDRLALGRLSVFSGAFPLDAAIGVISDDRLDAVQAATAIADLADKSLVAVRSRDGRTRLRLLETTRMYAAAKLADEGGHAVLRRHALHYALHLRGCRTAAILDPGVTPELGEDELGNIRAAMEWCFSTGGDATLGVELSALAVPSLLQHRSFDECARCCRQALDRMPPELGSTAIELVLWEVLSIANASMGLYGDDMLLAIQRGLVISRSLEAHRATFHLLAGMHLAMLGTNRYAESLDIAEQYAALAKDVGSASEEVIARWMIGASHHYMGSHALAEEQFTAARRKLALAGMRKLEYFDGKAMLNANLGVARTKLALGLPVQALQLAIKAIDEAREYPDSLFPCVTLFFPIFLLNNLDTAAETLLQTLNGISPEYRVGFRSRLIGMLEGVLLHHRGSPAEAEVRLRQSLPGMRMATARCIGLQAMADVLREVGKTEEAFTVIEEAIALSDSNGGFFSRPDLLRTKGEIMMALPQFGQSQAREVLMEAMRDAHRAGALGWEIAAALALARLEISQDRTDEAKAVLHPVYMRLAEGHETPLVREAATILAAH
ncbi:putative ATPase/DNA-binding winged helix-turn-helix (wHTH) protein [Lysobacter sp. OAE881]|uniref:ATP-binding protein n=1 Tax=Lysobacter sp. OAE881 TaxID=2663813 RepID=UPI00178B840B